MLVIVVVEHLNGQALQCLVVTPDNLAAAVEHFGVALQLCQPDSSHDVGHVTFVEWRNNIVLPGPELRFGQCVLVLAMQ